MDENESKDGSYKLDLNPDQKINITQIGNVKNIILSINASLINTITFFRCKIIKKMMAIKRDQKEAKALILNFYSN
ncbi:MAG: hypothetical protein CM1200mP10_25550 [Candidatus Neomarinimicrobiota bacterium]|nr:MAG: hypothetical protein CM1200mP10_25550 [Candidatus Neomarinimicrobiota bacterium]